MVGSMEKAAQEAQLRIFDSHTHLYSQAVISSVRKREGLADALCLDVEKATSRTDVAALKQECALAGVDGCLILPTAPAHKVREVNDWFLAAVQGEKSLLTAGTLHPSAPDQDKELERLSRCGVRALKLCSFSQGFDPEAPETLRFFEMIRKHNIHGTQRFCVILDTFYKADVYFGAPTKFVTTPRRLGRLAAAFPEIDFVGAHMGGLAAPYPELVEYLPPCENLYLDTSNAAHTLAQDEFLRLIQRHGPGHVLFGTDWPWFGHAEEAAHICNLFHQGGLSFQEQSAIFSGNIRRLLGL
jgi:predicted TIM-barrel fold metal-dependent hydrolase